MNRVMSTISTGERAYVSVPVAAVSKQIKVATMLIKEMGPILRRRRRKQEREEKERKKKRLTANPVTVASPTKSSDSPPNE